MGNINLSSSYVLSKFLPYVIGTSKNKRQQCSQTYRITTVSLCSSHNVYIRLPNKSDMAWDRYVTPFSYDLWLAVVITVCAISACLAITSCDHERNQNLSLSAILFYIHACFCRQGRIYKSCFLPS